MQVIRQIVDRKNIKSVFVPEEFGDRVEIIVLPVAYKQDRNESEYFECVAEDGTTYRVNNWTDDEFNKASMMGACKDDDTTAEELFDV